MSRLSVLNALGSAFGVEELIGTAIRTRSGKAEAAAIANIPDTPENADERYAAGVADYVEVTTTHTAALSAESAALAAQAARLNAAVSLVQALGGGWTNERMNRPTL